jgi:hypothetical protein
VFSVVAHEFFGLKGYGMSGPADQVYNHFELTVSRPSRISVLVFTLTRSALRSATTARGYRQASSEGRQLLQEARLRGLLSPHLRFGRGQRPVDRVSRRLLERWNCVMIL